LFFRVAFVVFLNKNTHKGPLLWLQLVGKSSFVVNSVLTSFLDIENEANLYRKLQELGVHYISVGHRTSILGFHSRVLDLRGRDNRRLFPVADYRPAIS
jgi:putative ATP-binding cassette transporter